MTLPLRIFVGWDPREAEAYHVFCHSLIRHASKPIAIIPLVQQQLRDAGLFWRSRDEKAATEFSMTRWLVPHLSGYEGVSIFADCDMLMQADIHEVVGIVDDAPVAVCQHDYLPKSTTKMDGQVQTVYPKKNWSSFMVFNNGHEKCRALTPELVSHPSHAPSYFHQFFWLDTLAPGALPLDWNWLVGEYERNPDAKNLHYTLGGPWFDQTKDCDCADLWLEERDRMMGLTPARAA